MSSPDPQALVLIPARLAATRLPQKPLLDIAGKPMIVQVWKRAMEAQIGTVVVATDSQDVVNAIEEVGGYALLTRKDHPSGSDRIYEALSKFDSEKKFDIIVNVQGDLPTIDSQIIVESLRPFQNNSDVDISTLVAEIQREEEKTNPNVVKCIASPITQNHLRALYFTRSTAPYGEGPLYHHIGLYAYRRNALERFVSLPPSYLEKREKLEQLRALEAGMRIDAIVVDDVPLGVDTIEDYERACRIMEQRSSKN